MIEKPRCAHRQQAQNEQLKRCAPGYGPLYMARNTLELAGGILPAEIETMLQLSTTGSCLTSDTAYRSGILAAEAITFSRALYPRV
jgi:hypothetical protein